MKIEIRETQVDRDTGKCDYRDYVFDVEFPFYYKNHRDEYGKIDLDKHIKLWEFEIRGQCEYKMLIERIGDLRKHIEYNHLYEHFMYNTNQDELQKEFTELHMKIIKQLNQI